jgi:hypothetical protein
MKQSGSKMSSKNFTHANDFYDNVEELKNLGAPLSQV